MDGNIDQVEGQCKSVISRWILKPGQWNINGNSISFRNTKIELESMKISTLN